MASSAIQVGRVCIKTKGRDAGTKVVVTKIIDKNFVMVRSSARKKNPERKCSILHLEPTDTIVNI
ncbi:MAG: 50S ribosomal protein L14e [Candidatus Micrarchaeota archaeon]|nr:50S ribosomal protein L14e [Candidatus Micrarchaeota archaeon]